MFRNLITAFAVLPLVIGAQGCATMLSNPAPVPVDSRPQGATVSLDEQVVGATPCTIMVENGSRGEFTITKDGYPPANFDRDKEMNGKVFWNLLWLLLWPVFPVAVIVDVATGNVGKYSSDPIYVEFAPGENTPTPGDTEAE